MAFEECPMDHKDFDPETGVFSCQQDGLYSVTLMGLMKAEENSPVRVKVMKEVNTMSSSRAVKQSSQPTLSVKTGRKLIFDNNVDRVVCMLDSTTHS